MSENPSPVDKLSQLPKEFKETVQTAYKEMQEVVEQHPDILKPLPSLVDMQTILTDLSPSYQKMMEAQLQPTVVFVPGGLMDAGWGKLLGDKINDQGDMIYDIYRYSEENPTEGWEVNKGWKVAVISNLDEPSLLVSPNGRKVKFGEVIRDAKPEDFTTLLHALDREQEREKPTRKLFQRFLQKPKGSPNRSDLIQDASPDIDTYLTLQLQRLLRNKSLVDGKNGTICKGRTLISQRKLPVFATRNDAVNPKYQKIFISGGFEGDVQSSTMFKGGTGVRPTVGKIIPQRG